MPQVRVWLGIIVLLSAGYLAFDPAGRMQLAWEKAVGVGPYVLIALAAVNLVRSLVRSASALIPPLLIATIAALPLVSQSVRRSEVEDATIAVAVLLALAFILQGSPERMTWTRVLWTGRTRAPASIGGRMRAVAVLAELRVDMLTSVVDDRATFVAITFGGRVVIDLPQEWRVVVRPPHRLLLAVLERGRRDAIAPGQPQLEVQLVGFGGTLELDRS